MFRRHVTVIVSVVSLAASACSVTASISPTGGSAVPVADASRSPEEVSTGPGRTSSPTVDPNYSGFETIALGTGGSRCSLDKKSKVFAPDDLIRVNATYTPSLRAGTAVTIRLLHDGAEVGGYPVTLHFDTETSCVYGDVSPGTLAAGHYRLEVAPDTAPTVSARGRTAPLCRGGSRFDRPLTTIW